MFRGCWHPGAMILVAGLACLYVSSVGVNAAPEPAVVPADSAAQIASESTVRQARFKAGGRGASACCTPDGCRMADDEYFCVAVYRGTWYEGETCRDDGGDFDCPVPEEWACCASGSCMMATEADCSYPYGGTWYEGETCAEAGGSFECPAEPGACCTTDGQCRTLTGENDCYELYDGTWYQGETCVGDGGNFECPVLAACCAYGYCYMTAEVDCAYGYGGTWYEGETCAGAGGSFECPAEPGACCTADGQCHTLTAENDCYELYDGTWYQGETCVGDGGNFECPVLAACCAYGQCYMTTDFDCGYGYGGTWYAGETCVDAGGDFECPAQGGSACCTVDGCVMMWDEYECLYVEGGTWYAGETCVEAGGDFECPGACCTENQDCHAGLNEELCLLLYPTATWYPGKLCPGAGGDFECPASPMGACCTEWGCETMLQADCEYYYPGSLFFEGYDCDTEDPCPPPQGACCVNDECVTTDMESCHIMAGGPGCWYHGEACPDQGGSFECPSCHEMSLFCQQPESGDYGTSWIYSDTSVGNSQFAYERFWELEGEVCGVHWFGYLMNGGTPCNDASGFIFRFFEIGDDLRPGAQVATKVVATADIQQTVRWDLSDQLYPLVLSEFEVEFDECVPLRDGYVSVIGMGADGCAFAFGASYEGHYATREGDGAYCLETASGGLKCGRLPGITDLPIDVFGPKLPGACCDDVAGTCEVVMPDECVSGRFVVGATCDELDPPCGGMAGACCSETKPCYLAYEQDCAGSFAGGGSTCDPIDCNNTGVGDACDIALGTSADCNGNGVPDECDIAAGGSDDYDGNGVPDECDPDRNENGVPDACDIDCATGDCGDHPLGCGGSTDCQQDGVPDDAQLGTMGDALLWDGGPPLVMHPDPWSIEQAMSQLGGVTEFAFAVDDFVVADGGAVINELEFYTETSPDFNWTGRALLRIHANSAFWSPEGALWQIDGDPDNAVVDLWIPDDVGTITRESDGSGYLHERYKWTISDVNIPVEAGAWFIGMAPEATGEAGYSYPCFGHATLEDRVRSEAWVRPRLEDPFIPLEVPEPATAWGGVDLAFRLYTNVYGQDDNGNGVPDECEAGLVCGDLDFDDDVDYDDYVIFLDAFGGPVDGTPPQDGLCDYDGTGAVGMADFDAWLGCYRAYVNDPLAGPPTVGKRRIGVPTSPLPKQGFGPVPSP